VHRTIGEVLHRMFPFHGLSLRLKTFLFLKYNIFIYYLNASEF
jgi:hypothetical protein